MQGIQKLIVALRNYPKICDLHIQMQTILKANPNGIRQKLLFKSVSESWRISKSIILSTILGNTFFAIWPVYQAVFRKEKVLFLNVILPFIDYTTSSGYTITCIFHYAFAFWGIIGNLANDLSFQILICNHRSMVALLSNSLQQIGSLSNNGCWNDKYRKLYLRNILIAFQEADK